MLAPGILNKADILSRLNTEQLFGHYFSDLHEAREDGGGNRMCRCPLHADDRPSCSVNLGQMKWNCHGCDARGDAVRLVELAETLPFVDALAFLDEHFTGTEAVNDLAPLEKRVNEVATTCQWKRGDSTCSANTISHDRLCQEHRSQWTREVRTEVAEAHERLRADADTRAKLRERRLITAEVIDIFQLGLSEDGRLTIPLYDLVEKEPSKALVGLKYYRWQPGDADKVVAKPLPRPYKGVVYGHTPPVVDTVYVVEGETDCWSLAGMGRAVVSVVTGAKPTLPARFAKYVSEKYPGCRVVVVGDNDMPGQAYQQGACEALSALQSNVHHIVWPEGLPQGYDVTDALRSAEGADMIEGNVVQFQAPEETPASEEPVTSDTPELNPKFWDGVPALKAFRKALRENVPTDDPGILAMGMAMACHIAGQRPTVRWKGGKKGAPFYGMLVGSPDCGKTAVLTEGAENVIDALKPHAGQMLQRFATCDKVPAGAGAFQKRLMSYEAHKQRLLYIFSELSNLFVILGGETQDQQKLAGNLCDAWDGRPIGDDLVNEDNCREVKNPCPSIIGGIQPDILDRNLKRGLATGGLMSRWYVFELGDGDEDMLEEGPIDEKAMETYRQALLKMDRFLGTGRRFEMSEGAKRFSRIFNERMKKRRAKFAEHYELFQIGKRTVNTSTQMAMLFAALECSEVITANHMAAAIMFARWQFDVRIRIFQDIGETDVQKTHRRVIEILKKNGGEMAASELVRAINSSLRPRLRQALAEAVQFDLISEDKTFHQDKLGRRRTTTSYCLKTTGADNE